MFATQSLLIIGIFFISSVISERVICDVEDSECLTKTAGLTFEEFIDGVPGVEPSDPLKQKNIDAKFPTLMYKFFDAKLSGMRKCKVELVKISSKDLKYDYHVGCPHLTLEAGYEIFGEIGTEHIEGKGPTCKIDFYDYHFKFHGDYVSTEKNGKTHIYLKTHELEIDANGKVVYSFENLFNGDKEKSEKAHNYVNKNWKTVDSSSRKPTMDALMDIYIEHVNMHMEKISFQDLFSYEK